MISAFGVDHGDISKMDYKARRKYLKESGYGANKKEEAGQVLGGAAIGDVGGRALLAHGEAKKISRVAGSKIPVKLARNAKIQLGVGGALAAAGTASQLHRTNKLKHQGVETPKNNFKRRGI